MRKLRRRNNIKNLLGSSRGRVFDEKKASKTSRFRRRPQKVKIRKRYAATIARQTAFFLLHATWILIVLVGFSWAGRSIWSYWQNSPALRVAEIQFDEKIPNKMLHEFPIRVGDHLWNFSPGKIESQLELKFPQVKKVNIHRGFNQHLSVGVVFHDPIVFWRKGEVFYGLTPDGIQIPLEENYFVVGSIPEMSAPLSGKWTSKAAQTLAEIKKFDPTFYLQIERLETDTIPLVALSLRSGIKVFWGTLSPEDAESKTKNLLTVMKQFEPDSKGASVRFTTANRIVLDRHWRKLSKK